MPPKIKIDDLIKALLEVRVQEALAKNRSSLLSLMIKETLKQKLESLLRTCGILQQENATLKSTVLALQNTNAEIFTTNKDLSSRLSEQETYSRRVNVVIWGLPDQSLAETAVRSSDGSSADDLQTGTSASVEQTAVSFFRTKLKLDITTQDILSAFEDGEGCFATDHCAVLIH